MGRSGFSRRCARTSCAYCSIVQHFGGFVLRVDVRGSYQLSWCQLLKAETAARNSNAVSARTSSEEVNATPPPLPLRAWRRKSRLSAMQASRRDWRMIALLADGTGVAGGRSPRTRSLRPRPPPERLRSSSGSSEASTLVPYLSAAAASTRCCMRPPLLPSALGLPPVPAAGGAGYCAPPPLLGGDGATARRAELGGSGAARGAPAGGPQA